MSSFLFLAFLLVATFNCVESIAFPSPTGPYNTSLSTGKIIDHGRQDPFSPIPIHRQIMISVFTPILPKNCQASLSPYMTPITAAYEDSRLTAFGLPSGIFESIDLSTCDQCSKASKLPVLLFSPAAGTTRLFYSAICQQVASFGYIVIMIDHPYDVDIVTFPDNSTILGLDLDDSQIPLAVDTRAKDMSFVLNQLSNRTAAKSLFPGMKCGPDIKKVGAFGHSLGGAAAAEAMLFDKRFAGGVNLDGSFFGDVVEKGLSRPFMIFAHSGKNISTDPTWETVWPKLTGWKRQLGLKESAHYTFSDLANVVSLLGFGDMLPAEVGEILGTIEGHRAFEIVTTYIVRFFDMVLKNKKGYWLDGPDATFPEVEFDQ